jgi:chromosome partitioning protein
VKHKEVKLGKTISICNQKGGVGKTTTAINLSAYLATAGKRVLIIDIDPQANATSGVGINKQSIQKSVYSVLIDSTRLEDVVLETTVKNMFLVPADLQLTGAQIELVSALNREQQLNHSIKPIKHNYDFIIIDCPPSLGLLTINALTASETTLIPLQCEYYAMEGLSQLLHTIKLVQDNLNPVLDIEGVVLTMADYRTNLTNEVIQEAREFFKEKVYDTIIPRSIRLSEAPGYGKPVMLYDKNSNGAEAYKSLSNEIIKRNTLTPLELQQKGNYDAEPRVNEHANPDSQQGRPAEEIGPVKETVIPTKILEEDGGDNGEA